MPPLTSKIAQNRRWSKLTKAQRDMVTKPARDAAWQRWLDAVPAEVTDPEDRARAARQARRAHMQALSLRTSQARRSPRTRLARLREKAPDLAGLVDSGVLTLGEAEAAAKARTAGPRKGGTS